MRCFMERFSCRRIHITEYLHFAGEIGVPFVDRVAATNDIVWLGLGMADVTSGWRMINILSSRRRGYQLLSKFFFVALRLGSV